MNDSGEIQSAKRNTSSSTTRVDRISSLPDETIHQIFSFLPTQNLVKSSVLSKRWTILWRSAPSLRFDLYKFCLDNRPINLFESFVDSVLQLRDPSDIQTFRLRWDYPILIYSPYIIYEWIDFAVRSNVQVFELYVGFDDYYDDDSDDSHHQREVDYSLPSSLFTCGSLIELTLDYSNALADVIPSFISLSRLKFLKLKSVTFPMYDESSREAHAAFFSAFPMLETLDLQDCVVNDYVLINIESLHLKMLAIYDGFRGSRSRGPCTINVNAPNLVQLRLVLGRSPDDRYLLNAPSVLNAVVKFDPIFHSLISQLEILRAISNARIVGLSCFDIEEHLLGELSFPFSNLKCLNLLRVRTSTITWIFTLIRHSSNIESLKVNLNEAIFSEHLTWKRDLIGSFPMLHHLKSVVIEDFQGYPNEIELVQFFLEKAAVLERMTINYVKVRKDSSQEEQLKKFSEKLSRYPQASPNVRITFQLRSFPY